MENKSIYYHDYLQLDKITNSQRLVSKEDYNDPAHDEMLFIVTHQAFELWFVQIQYELKSVIDLLKNPFDDNTEDFSIAIHRLERVKEIWKHLVEQYDILDTMTSLDFLDFRKYLSPGSGFQSYQFKGIEALLGLNEKIRLSPPHYHDQKSKGAYYKRVDKEGGALSQEHANYMNKIESSTNMFDALQGWLERMPFLDDKYWENGTSETYWEKYKEVFKESLPQNDINKGLYEELNTILEDGIMIYRPAIQIPLSAEEEQYLRKLNLPDDEALFKMKTFKFKRFTDKCVKAALFIKINRNLPIFHLPYQFLGLLADIDQLISMWRYKHYLVVRKMIGQRTGTGNTSGGDYLKGIIDYNTIFPELKILSTFLIERKKRPPLPASITSMTTFHQ